MKKQQIKKIEHHELEQFEDCVNIFTLISGGSGKGVALLRKIVDSIHANSCSYSVNILPSFLITGPSGSGKKLTAKALANSLALTDIRECPANFLDNGINSGDFFQDSTHNTAHIITDIHDSKKCESVLWRYLKERKCNYYNVFDGTFNKIIYCNGLIVMTAICKDAVPESLIKIIPYVIQLEPYTCEQVRCILHQYLFFMGIEYGGEVVLDELVKTNPIYVTRSLELLKNSINIMRAELKDYLSLELVYKAKRLMGEPLPKFGEDIPF